MRLSWRPRARQDLEDLANYINRDNPRAALRVARRIQQRIADLADYPDAGRPGRGEFRELIVTKTPYVVLYRKLDAEIEIVSITHGVRDH